MVVILGLGVVVGWCLTANIPHNDPFSDLEWLLFISDETILVHHSKFALVGGDQALWSDAMEF